MSTQKELIQLAQEKLHEVIDVLEFACDSDEQAKAYIINHLKIACSDNHGFVSTSLNLDNLINNADDNEDIGGEEFFEDYETN